MPTVIYDALREIGSSPILTIKCPRCGSIIKYERGEMFLLEQGRKYIFFGKTIRIWSEICPVCDRGVMSFNEELIGQ